jgi:phosphoglycerate dehydrogenase-like enzyme
MAWLAYGHSVGAKGESKTQELDKARLPGPAARLRLRRHMGGGLSAQRVERQGNRASWRRIEMRIAVMGTGPVGQALAGKLADLGHEVVVGTRDPEATLARTEPD